MMINEKEYSVIQLTVLVVSRILIGWYCLYEGVVKLMNTNWTSYAYLSDSKGLFAPFFKGIAANPTLLQVVDFLNVWGLVAIGLGLILGLFTRVAAVAGVALLGLYCLSHPALIDANYLMQSGDNTLWIDKNLIFIFLLLILVVFPTGRIIGIDRLIFKKRKSDGK
jgi:thiosulfate dehydrogenase [quinone] large subunit